MIKSLWNFIEWLDITHGPTNRLDFGGNPDPDPDRGIFWRNLTIAILAIVKDPRRGFVNSPKICAASGPQIEEIKCCLGKSLRSPITSSFFYDIWEIFASKTVYTLTAMFNNRLLRAYCRLYIIGTANWITTSTLLPIGLFGLCSISSRYNVKMSRCNCAFCVAYNSG